MKTIIGCHSCFDLGPVILCAFLFATFGATPSEFANDKPVMKKTPEQTSVKAQRANQCKAKAKEQSRTSEPKKKALVTGSLIPRTLNRQGRIVDAPHAVTILDQADIERSGASTLSDALRRLSTARVTGP